jgi:uncharacterized coiled-coil DUF342 family protein
MAQRLSQLRHEYQQLTPIERNSENGILLLAEIKDLNDELTEADKQVEMIFKDFWL